jgi:hypothetical protein
MNSTFLPFQYEAVAQFTGYIRYALEEDEKPGDRVEFFKGQDEQGDEYRVYAKLSKDNLGDRETRIETLILQKNYLVEQSLEDFWEYAKEKINSYAYRLVGFSGDWSATVANIFVKDKNDYQYHPYEFPHVRYACYPYVVKKIDKSKFCNLINAPKSEFLDEYIERYYFIENDLIKDSKTDPVLILISLSNLFELIQKNEGDPLEDYPLLTATRGLVVHGVVTYNKTITPLNERLGTSQSSFKFSRNNLKHMELVREANLALHQIITNYIEELLRDRGRA